MDRVPCLMTSSGDVFTQQMSEKNLYSQGARKLGSTL